jgi:hypothetical protein
MAPAISRPLKSKIAALPWYSAWKCGGGWSSKYIRMMIPKKTDTIGTEESQQRLLCICAAVTARAELRVSRASRGSRARAAPASAFRAFLPRAAALHALPGATDLARLRRLRPPFRPVPRSLGVRGVPRVPGSLSRFIPRLAHTRKRGVGVKLGRVDETDGWPGAAYTDVS